MYLSIAEVRAGDPDQPEGGFPEYSDEEIQARILEWQAFIEKITGRVFEEREMELWVRASPSGKRLYLPQVPVSISKIEDPKGNEVSDYIVVNNPSSPYIEVVSGSLKGDYKISGTFGYLENGETPPAIKKALLRLVVFDLRGTPLTLRAGIKEESTDGRTAKFGLPSLTGDREIDHILATYRRPPLVRTL